MYKLLQSINQLLEKAMEENDSKRVQELRDQLPRAYNDALDSNPLLQNKIKSEYSRLDRAYFDYCDSKHPLPDPYVKSTSIWA
jgi:hypothetical protein